MTCFHGKGFLGFWPQGAADISAERCRLWKASLGDRTIGTYRGFVEHHELPLEEVWEA